MEAIDGGFDMHSERASPSGYGAALANCSVTNLLLSLQVGGRVSGFWVSCVAKSRHCTTYSRGLGVRVYGWPRAGAVLARLGWLVDGWVAGIVQVMSRLPRQGRGRARHGCPAVCPTDSRLTDGLLCLFVCLPAHLYASTWQTGDCRADASSKCHHATHLHSSSPVHWGMHGHQSNVPQTSRMAYMTQHLARLGTHVEFHCQWLGKGL